jgi:hypothetical protein
MRFHFCQRRNAVSYYLLYRENVARLIGYGYFVKDDNGLAH